MRRVLPDKRGVAGFGSCGHQPGTLGRPPQVERQRERAGTPARRPRGGREQMPCGPRDARPGSHYGPRATAPFRRKRVRPSASGAVRWSQPWIEWPPRLV
jgi:hypothetical protein